MGLCPVRSSMGIIVTQITTVVFCNVATVTSQLLLSRARRCIGHKWLMDQMCSKCEKHCFSHNLQKISKNIFLSEFVFFREFFLTNMFFLTIIFSNNVLLLSRPLHCIKVICIQTAYFT